MEEDGQHVVGRRLGVAGGLGRGVEIRGRAEVLTVNVPPVATPGRSARPTDRRRAAAGRRAPLCALVLCDETAQQIVQLALLPSVEMVPAGISAGVAIHDASLLASRLVSEAPLPDAVRAYEREMLDYGFAAVATATRVVAGGTSAESA
ncbi:hypothetical protein ACWC9T_27490 [Kitasatospora sp. NPDC001159]